MISKLIERLFGKWETIYVNSDVQEGRKLVLPNFEKVSEYDVVLVVERHTKTEELRAYTKLPNGKKSTKWDMDYIRGEFDLSNPEYRIKE